MSQTTAPPPMLGDAFTGGDLAELTRRAARVRSLVDESRESL